MRFKIIVRRQYLGTDQLLLQNVHEVQQIFWLVVANVIDCIRRNRQTIFSNLSFRCSLHHTLYTFYNVICIGKITLAVAIVENLDCLPLQQLIGKTEVSHIRATRRTVKRKETQSCGRNIVELTVSMSQKLVGFLSCGIQ